MESTQTNMNDLLRSLGACYDAYTWAKGKSWEEIYLTCHRGDWLLWLFRKVNPKDKRKLTLAKGWCANTVQHLMKDKRSIAAVQAAINFGEEKINEDELAAAAYAAYDAAADADDADAAADAYDAAAYAAADADDADAAADAYDAAAYAAAAAAYAADAAAYAADAYAAYAAYAAAARASNRKLTADICRKYLPIETWNIR